jgi:hypothetical protein
VAQQLLLGNLGETGIKKRLAYAYPVVRRPLTEIGKEELSKIAVLAAAGIVAEYGLCSDVGVAKDFAVADDVRQLKGIQRIAGFSDEEMEAFKDEAKALVETYEPVIRKVATELNRRNKLSGEQVMRLIDKGAQ